MVMHNTSLTCKESCGAIIQIYEKFIDTDSSECNNRVASVEPALGVERASKDDVRT